MDELWKQLFLPLPPLLTSEGPPEQPAGLTPHPNPAGAGRLGALNCPWWAWVVTPLASPGKLAVNSNHRFSRGILGTT